MFCRALALTTVFTTFAATPLRAEVVEHGPSRMFDEIHPGIAP
jgi:hypothetical protein